MLSAPAKAIKLKVKLDEPTIWFQWKSIVTKYFAYIGVLDVVTGERRLTTQSTDEEKAKFARDETIAMIEMQQAIGERYRSGCWSLETAKETFDFLEKSCLGDIYIAREICRKELENTEWKTIAELISNFRIKKNEYKALAGMLSDHELTRMLLRQLPEKYVSLRIQLERENATKANVDIEKKAVQSAANALDDLLKKRELTFKGAKRNIKKDNRCFKCGKKGHMENKSFL